MQHAILIEDGRRFYIAHSKLGERGVYRIIATMTSRTSALQVLAALQKEEERKFVESNK
jgi:hypothetical protein